MADSIGKNELKVNLEKVLWISVVFTTVFIPFLMTLIALVHIDDCPHQPYIPIVILMAGIFMSLSNVINTADKYSPPKQISYKKRKHIIGCLNVLTNCLTIACITAGALWIYGKGKPSYNKSSADYCNPTLYLFSFWLLNVSLVFIVLVIITLIIGFVIKYLNKS